MLRSKTKNIYIGTQFQIFHNKNPEFVEININLTIIQGKIIFHYMGGRLSGK